MTYRVIVVRQHKTTELQFFPHETINTRIYGASRARNIGLHHIKSAVKADDYIAFPDDDSYYNIRCGSRASTWKADIIIGSIWCPINRRRLGLPVKRLDNLKKFNEIYPKISCPSFFIRYGVVDGANFNETYGPGAMIPAVEETEFLFGLASEQKLSFLFDNRLIIHHLMQRPSLDKVRSYAFAQGFFYAKHIQPLRGKFNTTYLWVILRPYLGLALSVLKLNLNDTIYYLNRCAFIMIGIYKGLIKL